MPGCGRVVVEGRHRAATRAPRAERRQRPSARRDRAWRPGGGGRARLDHRGQPRERAVRSRAGSRRRRGGRARPLARVLAARRSYHRQPVARRPDRTADGGADRGAPASGRAAGVGRTARARRDRRVDLRGHADRGGIARPGRHRRHRGPAGASALRRGGPRDAPAAPGAEPAIAIGGRGGGARRVRPRRCPAGGAAPARCRRRALTESRARRGPGGKPRRRPRPRRRARGAGGRRRGPGRRDAPGPITRDAQPLRGCGSRARRHRAAGPRGPERARLHTTAAVAVSLGVAARGRQRRAARSRAGVV